MVFHVFAGVRLITKDDLRMILFPEILIWHHQSVYYINITSLSHHLQVPLRHKLQQYQ